MTYAIIKVAGKQYRVREGERLLVDRLAEADGTTFSPAVLLVGGDGQPALAPSDVKVTARVLGAAKGPKIRIGKYKKRTGYRRHTGFRASLTQIEIEAIGEKRRQAAPKKEAAEEPAEKPAAAKAEKVERPKGMPAGYEDLTVAEIKDAVSEWNAPMLVAALEYEQEHAKRKGALAAIESAIAAKEEGS
ncbi:MAG TPA: 50S ribosomal protein L21 [Gaiellaceae bacterium]|nr:50S ribosomal protein L21 [Gaiellaceae bacterium]